MYRSLISMNKHSELFSSHFFDDHFVKFIFIIDYTIKCIISCMCTYVNTVHIQQVSVSMSEKMLLNMGSGHSLHY